MAMIITY